MVSADHETLGHTSAQQQLPDSCKSQTSDHEVLKQRRGPYTKYFLGTSKPTKVNVDDNLTLWLRSAIEAHDGDRG